MAQTAQGNSVPALLLEAANHFSEAKKHEDSAMQILGNIFQAFDKVIGSNQSKIDTLLTKLAEKDPEFAKELGITIGGKPANVKSLKDAQDKKGKNGGKN